MASGVILHVSLYGAFRPYSDGSPLALSMPKGASLTDIRKQIGMTLQAKFPSFAQHGLIDESALADEKEILREDYTVTRDANLALLPPVCGG